MSKWVEHWPFWTRLKKIEFSCQYTNQKFWIFLTSKSCFRIKTPLAGVFLMVKQFCAISWTVSLSWKCSKNEKIFENHILSKVVSKILIPQILYEVPDLWAGTPLNPGVPRSSRVPSELCLKSAERSPTIEKFLFEFFYSFWRIIAFKILVAGQWRTLKFWLTWNTLKLEFLKR